MFPKVIIEFPKTSYKSLRAIKKEKVAFFKFDGIDDNIKYKLHDLVFLKDGILRSVVVEDGNFFCNYCALNNNNFRPDKVIKIYCYSDKTHCLLCG